MNRNSRFHLLIVSLAIFVVRSDSVSDAKPSAGFPGAEAYERLSRVLDDDTYTRSVIDRILKPRVPGTQNHTDVVNFITDELKGLGWHVEHDAFVDDTPIGKKEFTNIIATPNPNSRGGYLDVACHFETKMYRRHHFVGAMDAAVPCAIMLQLARAASREIAANAANADVNLRFLFFDGEEAFVKWSERDSLYGSRHLARKYRETNQLKDMNLLVLLDLLGPARPEFYNFHYNDAHAYMTLVEAEERLTRMGALEDHAKKYFLKKSSDHWIADDHLPFLEKGVPVLHVIPVPFPPEWHTPKDDYDVIDFATVRNLSKIFAAFVYDYLKFK